jgi:hypothetical protein
MKRCSYSVEKCALNGLGVHMTEDQMITELAEEIFQESSKTWDAVMSHYRGHLSDQELLDRLAYLKQGAPTLARAQLEEMELEVS